MYVTKRLSHLRKFPSELSEPPPEGPGSGVLVIQDEEAEPTCCFGPGESERLFHLPLPQNKKLELSYATGFYPNRIVHFHGVSFIPVLNQPLSSNKYYAIPPYGKDRGEAFTSSKEEDVTVYCCFCTDVDDEQPRLLNPQNKYQQVEILRHLRGFVAKSVAPDGHPPSFLRFKGWRLDASSSNDFELGEASGLNVPARNRLPEFNVPLEIKSSKPVVVGKWYCPFVFVREGPPRTLRDEKNTSMFYEITLEQSWEQVFYAENQHWSSNSLKIETEVKTEVVTVGGREAEVDETNLGDGVLWFRSHSNLGEESSVGVSLVVIERMRWEEERVGWNGGEMERQVRMSREEKFGAVEWKRFGYYVLVERFVLKRMDGSQVLAYEFKHTDRIRSKWE